MQKWEGRILEIEDGLFTAELVPLDHPGPTLLANFDLELLAPDDAMVRPGDMVYLTVRTIRESSGYKTSTSALRLKRLGRWSKKELDEIKAAAQQESSFFEQYAD